MSMTKAWETLPNADLSDRANWRSLGNDRYAALRAQLLIVQSADQKSRFGPVIKAFNVAPEDTHQLGWRREQVISRTTTISEAIKFATTSRVCDQLAANISAELSTKLPGFSGKLNSEILSKSEYEITAAAENVLNTMTSHVIQETQEDEHVITLKGGTNPRVAELRRRYWPRRWDFYLHSCEYMEVSYRRSWYWWQIRDTIKTIDSGVLGWPLVSVVFYEPQAGVDVCYGPIVDELSNPDCIEILTLTEPMPRSIAPAKEEELEELAELAFPVTKEEKVRSHARLAPTRKIAAPRKGVRKAAAKKALRKMAASKKRVTARTAVRKTPAKKTAQKRAASKKRVTARRGVRKSAARRSAR